MTANAYPWNISSRELEILMTPLMLQATDSDQLIATFCDCTWSFLCEPGDALAGLLTEALSSREALRLLLNQADPATIAARLAEVGYLDTAQSRFPQLLKTLAEGIERWSARLIQTEIIQALLIQARLGGRVLTSESQFWPNRINDLGWSAPRVLWLRGSAEALQFDRSVSIVGSRASSQYGQEVTHEIVHDLVKHEVTIVSGGAYGIDSAAHRAALASGGNTVAVMAGGLDRLYPVANTQLLNQVIKFGAVISEAAPGTAPTRWRFLQRNRLIAALADATLVVEAGWRSGSINTVNHALELQREVGAIPGSIMSQNSQGCHRLIRDNKAQLIAGVSDILGLLGDWIPTTSVSQKELGPLELRVLDAISFKTIELEEISRRAGLTSAETIMGIGSLQLLDLVESVGIRWRRPKRAS